MAKYLVRFELHGAVNYAYCEVLSAATLLARKASAGTPDVTFEVWDGAKKLLAFVNGKSV